MRDLCRQLDVPDPDGLADALSLLFEDATVRAQVSDSLQTAQITRKVAKTMIVDAIAQQANARVAGDRAAAA